MTSVYTHTTGRRLEFCITDQKESPTRTPLFRLAEITRFLMKRYDAVYRRHDAKVLVNK